MDRTFIIRLHPGDSIQRTLDELPEGRQPVLLQLEAGIYREKVTLCRPNVTLEGAGRDETVISWGDGAFSILENGEKRGTFRTATLRTDGDCITLRRLTVENTAGPREKVGQAIALYADGDRFLCEDCLLRSGQDTLFTAPLPPYELEKGGFIGPKQYAPRKPQRHQYRRCTIIGDVDFIFGGAAAWFEDCDLISIDNRQNRTEPYTGYITAASTPLGQKYGYVFSNCRLTGQGIPDGSVYLGRPWREHARTTFLHCVMGKHIAGAGFHDWGKADAHETIVYAEYGSKGPGAAGKRADYVQALTAEEADRVTLTDLLTSMGDP